MSQLPEENGSYQVVARRYRPQEFGALIGQDHVARILASAIETGRVGHAYLFTGARGVGKTSTARIFAKALNCEKGPTVTPCNTCEICRAITSGDDIDVLEIDGASNRGVEEVRQIRLGTTVRPSRSRYKIYIIDEVHMLTRDAFNALLKTLEEPPAHVKFIFCTTEPNKIPITILSRCQRFDFAGINTQQIAEHLANVAQNEGVKVEEGVCETLARRASGSMRDALSLLEQLLSFAAGDIKLADVHGMLGTVDDRNIDALLDGISAASPETIFPILSRAADEGVDFGVMLEQLLGTFRDLLALTAGCSAKELIYASPSRFDELKKIANTFGPDRILASMQVLDQTIFRMRYSTQGRILAELAILRLARLGRMEEISALIEQLRSGKLGANVSLSNNAEKKTANGSASIVTPSSTAANVQAVSSETAQTPSNGAIPAQTVDPATLDAGALMRLWRKATESLGLSFSAQAKSVQAVRFIAPNRFSLDFPHDAAAAAKYCDLHSDRIAQALEPLVAGTVMFEFRTLEPPPALSADEGTAPPVSRYELMRKTMTHEMVREAGKLFGAELVDVKSPNTQ